MSPNFPRFTKNLHKLTPGGSGRPTTNLFGIIVGRKLSKSFNNFTWFRTLRPQIFMASDLDLRFLVSQISDPCISDFWPLDLRFLTLGSKLFFEPQNKNSQEIPSPVGSNLWSHQWGDFLEISSLGRLNLEKLTCLSLRNPGFQN